MGTLSATEWAEIFKAGWLAIPNRHEPAANAIGLALAAMEDKATEIAERRPSDRMTP